MQQNSKNYLFLILLYVCLFPQKVVLAKQTIGWVDSARIYPVKIVLRARMDTGAKTSSLRGKSIQQFIRDGQEWVRVVITTKRGYEQAIEHRIVRFTKIKQHSGTAVRHPVIQLGICVSDIYKETDVSIVERAEFNYPLLIGRNFLEGSFLVDSSKTFMTRPVCKQ